jgi:hypothetical protein
MPLNKAQKAVTSSNARFKIFVAGRRTGKTALSIRELARYASQPNKRVLYVCPTFQMARDIIWKDLQNKLRDLNWIAKTNESRLEIELINGSLISLKSGNDPDNLRGSGYDFVVFDECADLKPEVWYEVVRPALSAQKPPGSALFCGTPKGFNWFKDLFDLGNTEDPDWFSHQATTLEGGNVPEKEIEDAKKDLDARTFSQEYLATFETYSGIIAYNFHADNIKQFKGDIGDMILIGMDFNVDPMSAVVMVKTETGLHAIDEINIYGSNTNEMCEEIRNRYPKQKVVVFPDPAGAQRKTSASGRTDISILQNAGFAVKYRQRHPAVKDRINALNSVLKNTEGQRRFFIDPKCKTFVKSLRQHSYKEGTQIPDKGSGLDHIFDAGTYLIEFIYPVKKDYKPDNMKTFGVY